MDHLGVKLVSVVNYEADVVYFDVVTEIAGCYGELGWLEVKQVLYCSGLKG